MSQFYPIRFIWNGVCPANRDAIETLFRKLFVKIDPIGDAPKSLSETIDVVIGEDPTEKDPSLSSWKINIGAQWGERWNNPSIAISTVLTQVRAELAGLLMGLTPKCVSFLDQGVNRYSDKGIMYRYILKARADVAEAPHATYVKQDPTPYQNFAADLTALIKKYHDTLSIDYSINPLFTSKVDESRPVTFSISEDGLQFYITARHKTEEVSAPEPAQPTMTFEEIPKSFVSDALKEWVARLDQGTREKASTAAAEIRKLDLKVPEAVMSGVVNVWSQLFQQSGKVDSTKLSKEDTAAPPNSQPFQPKTQAELAQMSEVEYRDWVMKVMEDPAHREAFIKSAFAATSEDGDSDPYGAIARMDGTPEELGAAVGKELCGDISENTPQSSTVPSPETLEIREVPMTTGEVYISGNFDIKFLANGTIEITPRETV